MNVKPITTEQAAEFSDLADTIATEPTAVPDFDAKFIEMFHKLSNNGTEAYLAAIAPKKVKRSSARTYASRLMKKYNLRSKLADARNKVKVEARVKQPTQAEDVIRYVKKQFIAGTINEEEVWEKVSELARYSTNESVQLKANDTLMVWIKEAKQELSASALSEQDVVTLCIDTVSALSPEKYLGVLRGVRKKRQELIKKRTEVLDVDAIIAEERRLAAQ